MNDLDAITETWLQVCGTCDYGIHSVGCTHPDQDYRPVILRLVEEITELRTLLHREYRKDPGE